MTHFDDKLYTACGYVTPPIVILTLLIKLIPSVVMFDPVFPLIVNPLLKSVGDDLKGVCKFCVNAMIICVILQFCFISPS